MDISSREVTRYAPAPTDIALDMLGIAQTHLLRPIDMANVACLTESDEEYWDPIEVRAWPSHWPKPAESVRYHVISGNHRTTAAKIKGLASLKAIIIEAESEIAYLEAGIRTNARHGKNFSSDEKRGLALKLKELGMSGRDISELLSVSKSTANNWISGRDTNASRKRKAQADAEQPIHQSQDWDWDDVPPDVNIVKITATGSAINDFLASAPLSTAKEQIVGWAQSLPAGRKRDIAAEMGNIIAWVSSVTSLLTTERGVKE